MGQVNIYIKSFTLVQRNAVRRKMNNFKLKILNNYGKSAESTNDWNAPTITVFFVVVVFNGERNR